MKINGSNSVQGLYNYNTTPDGVIFTPGDIVLSGTTFLACLSESTTPDVSGDSWELYLDSLSPKETWEDTIASDPNSLVSAKVLIDFLSNQLPGSNYDGTLKEWTEGDLSKISSNTKFLVSFDTLSGIEADNPGEIPFSLTSDTSTGFVYVVTTLTNLIEGTSTSTEIGDLLIQEFSRINTATAETITYSRTGSSLEGASWVPLTLGSNVDDYINYTQRVIASYQLKKDLFDSFVTDVSNGEYKLWKTLETSSIGSSIQFTNSGTYSRSKYYKLYLTVVEGGITYKESVDVSPEDHNFLSNGEKMYYKRVSGVYLTKTLSTLSTLTLPSNVTVTSIVESTDLVL